MTIGSFSLFSVLVVGLAAGLLFGWSVSVIPGLGRVSDQTYVSTMQSINREIINPLFIVTFLGPPLLLGLAAVLQLRAHNSRRGLLLGAAAGTYLVGVLGVTIGGNVPLNNGLDRFDLGSATVAALAEQRRDYETSWNRLHTIRTLASVLALALALSAMVAAETADGS